MTQIPTHLDRANPGLNARLVWLAIPAVGVALAAAVLTEPILSFAAILTLGLAFSVTRSMDWITYFVLFVIYSNVAVVAVKFHGVPPLAANAVPLLLGVPLLYYVGWRRDGIVLGPALPWAILFGIVQLLGVLCSGRPEIAWEGFQTYLIEGLCLYLLVTNLVRTPTALRGAIWSVLIAGCLMGGVPLLQQLTGTFDNNYGGMAQTDDDEGFKTGIFTAVGETMQPRLAGPIGEKNRYGQIMLLLIPLGLYRLRSEDHVGLRAAVLIALFLIATGVLLAFSRGMIVAAGLVVLFAAGMGYVSRTKVAVGFLLVLAALLLTPQYRVRLASLANISQLASSGKYSTADGALKGRAAEMGAAALVFLDNPVVGVGPGMFRHYAREYGERIGMRALERERQSHCLPLDVAAENGLLGFLCLLAIFWVTCRSLGRARQLCRHAHPKLSDTATAFLLVIVVYLASGLFLHFAFIRYFWLMLALADAAALIALRADCERQNQSFRAATAA